ncbi:MAG TPA: LCP family protein [Anaerolineales bacterium]|nr:LCP family protein [Anaerolineales bacterium]
MSYKTLTPLKLGLITLFIIAAMFAAYAAYTRSYDFFLSLNIVKIPGLAILNTPTAAVNSEGTPLPTPLPTQSSGPAPAPWDGASRVTMLVMGLDYRDWEAGDGPPRTDTMILLTVDPLTKTAGMLNIPRDLWVSIPGYEYGRINTAYPLGIAYNDPSGGGPGLAMKTVEQLLGIPIDYYAIIDFFAFEQFIDILSGINMTVYNEIAIDPIGKANTVVLKPGNYIFNGSNALAYARARHTEGGDFDRANRQQQVILAIKDRIIELGPAKIAALAPEIYNELSAGIHTNLSLEDALKLGWLALEIPSENIMQGAIAPPNAVTMAKSPDGAQDILIPVPDQVRVIRDQVFASTSMASPGLIGGDTRANMVSEGASIVVSNGTYVEGLATETQAYLQSQGANVVGTQNNEYTTYTKIIDYTGKPYTDRYLVDLMQITRYDISFQYDPNSPVDVLVILGDDWAGNNPMP